MTHSQTTPLFRERMTALATHLGTSYDEPWADEWDAYEPYFGCGIGVTLDRWDNPDYYILTDEEANTAVNAYVRDNINDMSPGYIGGYLKVDSYLIRSLQGMYVSNAKIIALIESKTTFDTFVTDMVANDHKGRGWFIGSFDGKETKVGDFYIYRMN